MNYLKENIKKNKTIYDKILKQIKKYDTIVIFRHIMPDFDALGCQFGLYEWLKINFPNKNIKTTGDNHVAFSGKIFPFVDKLSDDDLNSNFLAIICDVGDKKRIADPRFEKADCVIKIDHHPSNENLATIEIKETDKSSCSEMVANMLIYFKTKKFELNKDASKYLYIGMVGDNGRFLYNSTSAFTFNIAAELEQTGINLTKIYESMYTKDLKALEIIKFVLTNYKLTSKGVCYYVLEQKDLERLGITCDQGKENVNFFSNYDGVNIWMSITEDVTEPCFRISLRSRNYCVDKVANIFQGGGHKQASGCQIKDLTELPKLIKALEETIEKEEK